MSAAAPTETFWHIVRNGRLVQGMIVRFANAKRIASERFPDGDYRVVAASGRAELRQMGIIVDNWQVQA